MLLLTPKGETATDPLKPTRQAISRAVDFLRQAQQPDGSFVYYQCRDETMADCERFCSPPSQRWTPYAPIFSAVPTAEILTSLLAVEDPRAAAVLEKGAQFVKAQVDENGLCGFYPMVEPEAGPQCIGEFRQLYATVVNRSLLETFGLSLPPILPALLTYQRADGAFYPFFIPPAEVEAITSGGPAQERFRQRYEEMMRYHGPNMLQRMDAVDPLTNAMVFAYLVQQGQVPTALCEYLVQVVQQAQVPVHPAYIRNPFLLPHAISRAYAQGASCLEPAKVVLRPRLLQQQRSDGSWGSALDTALAMTSLLHFGDDGPALDAAVQFLLDQQQSDGSWKRAVWWVILQWRVRSSDGWLASEEISTGYVLETLGIYGNRSEGATGRNALMSGSSRSGVL